MITRSAAPLRQQTVDELRQSIVTARLEPGARLIERELIAAMGVSRTVIREALRQLESEGLVHVIPNRGAAVRELSLADAEDLYSIRAALEGLAARLFVENASNTEVERLERALERTVKAYQEHDPALVLREKNRFYEVLFRGAASESLSSMLATVHARVWRWRALGLSHPRRGADRSTQSVLGLRALLSAVKRRDAGLAERIAQDEVDKAAAEVARLLGGGTAASPPGASAGPGVAGRRETVSRPPG